MCSFRVLERSCRFEGRWRLVTVEEAQKNIDSVKELLKQWEWERARLLDGWIGGSAYHFRPTVGFRSCLGYMLVVESPSPTTSLLDDIIKPADYVRGNDLYSGVTLTEEGRSAAMLLCCEDWNYEVFWWLNNIRPPGGIRRSDEMEKASILVSDFARELTSKISLSKRLPKTDFSNAFMSNMLSHNFMPLLRKVKELTDSSSALDLMDEIWSELNLTEDLSLFQDFFGFDTTENSVWEAMAETLRYFAADVIAVCTVRDLVDKNILIKEERIGDLALVASIFACGNNFIDENVFGENDSLWSVVEGAGTEAKGDYKLFCDILHCQGFGTFCHKGKYGVLNAILVHAAKEGDVYSVECLINCGVEPLETDDPRDKTALHHAAKLYSESDGVVIAEKLLRGSTSGTLANATDYKGRTPLHRAAACGHARMCELLIKHKASLRSKDYNGQIPLHYALVCSQLNEEVIRVLINDDSHGNTKTETETETAVETSTLATTSQISTVDAKDEDGRSPLDLAVLYEPNNVTMVTLLLSMSDQSEVYFEQLDTASCLRQSSRMGYLALVEKLLKRGTNPLDKDSEGKTAFHYAAEGKDERVAREIMKKLRIVCKEGLVTACDKYGRSVLHVTAFVGHKTLCEWLLWQDGIDADAKDLDGQSALYYAVAGNHDNDEVLDVLIFTSQGINKVNLKDSTGTTPLHIAAAAGNLKMVDKLLSRRLHRTPANRKKFVQSADVLGQTALHKAARGGHTKVVKKLLAEGAHPLTERDCDGKTALHCAAQAEKSEDAIQIANILLNKCNRPHEKALLLFASAVGIGTAEESSASKPSLKLKNHLADQRKLETKEKVNLLQVAARLGNIDMTRELLGRGGNIADIRNIQEENKNVQHVLQQIDHIVEHGTDQPTLSDDLGRSAFANGLAALFLNPFVKSPITVGISGEWGMGKSSVMVQTEYILLKTAAQLPFSNSLQVENFPGASTSKLSTKGEAILQKIKDYIRRLPAGTNHEHNPKSTEEKRNGLSDWLNNNHPKCHQVLKSLAVMDRTDLFETRQQKEDKKESIGNGQMQGSIPSILTVRYNAWRYRNESEAWAGLAVEITKELEQTMTVAEKLRTSWKYNWKSRKRSIVLGVFVPCLLAVLLVFWFTTIVWLVLKRVKVEYAKDFKYGSLPATVIVVVWSIVKSVMSVAKPISSQMLDYICLPDHTEKLGYHQKVIEDIKFLKDELGHRASWLWRIFAFIWCCFTFCWNENYVPETTIPKMAPASKDNLRILVFVDDLDRCQENVILQILSAINLVLANCEINVVLGMDKSMIERAIIRMFGDRNNKPNKSSQDLADKFLRKIIQLPLDLPDPSRTESKTFLQGQLGMLDSRKEAKATAPQTESETALAPRKMNPKFRTGSYNYERDPKRGIKGTMTSLGEAGGIKRTESISDAAGEMVNSHLSEKNLERMETIESVEDTKVQEERNHILDVEGEGTTSPLSDKTEHKRRIEESDDHIPNTHTYGNLVTSCIKKLRSSLWPKQPGNSEVELQLFTLSPITSEMLIPKYSEGEGDAFYFLQTYTTGSRKIPREWKRLLTYHRLAWNILPKIRPVKALAGWQVQLIVWVFFCWQWRDPMNTIIEDWQELGVLKNWMTVHDDQQGEMAREKTSGPSLKEIVQNYIDERWPAEKNSSRVTLSDQGNLAKPKEKDACSKEEDEEADEGSSRKVESATFTSKEEDLREEVEEVERGNSSKQKELQGRRHKKGEKKQRKQLDLDEGLKIMIKEVLREEEVENWIKEIFRDVLKEEREKEQREKEEREKEKHGRGNKEEENASHQGKGKVAAKRKTEMEEEEKERKEWIKLREALSRYNVSMDGIQAFQMFRFYCVPGHLHWPLHKPE